MLKKIGWIVFKVFLLLLLTYVIASRWGNFQQFSALSFQQFSSLSFVYLFLVLLLMPINWFLEIKKWQLLLQSHQVNFSTAMKSVFGGLTIGMATPARVGEFAGRIVFFDDAIKKDALLKSAYGGLAQSFFTIAAPLLFLFFNAENYIGYYSKTTIYLTLVGLLLVLSFLFFINKILSISFVKKYFPPTIFSQFPKSIQLKIFAYSGLRYCIYLLQYSLLFYALDMPFSFVEIIGKCSLLLFFQSISPLASWIDLPIRSGLAVGLFHYTGMPIAFLTFIPFIIWLINLLLPSLMGYFFIYKLNTNATKS